MTTTVRRTTPRRALLGAAVAVSLLALGTPLSTAAPAPATASTRAAVGGVVGEWTQYQGGAAHTGAATDTTLDRAALKGLAPVWHRDVTGSIVAPVVAGGLVYVADETGLSALRVADGALAWHTDLPTKTFWRGAPAVSEGTVVVVGELRRPTSSKKAVVSGLDSATGALLWRHYLSEVAEQGVTISKQAVYVTVAGRLSKLWLRSGRLAWTSKAAATSTASVVGDDLFVTNQSGGRKPLSVTSVDAATGAVKWSRPLSERGGCGSWANGTVLVAEHVAYAGDCYGSLRAVGTSVGRNVWTTNVPLSMFNPMAASQDLLYATGSSGLLAIDRLTGAVRWTVTSDPSFFEPSPVVVGDTLVVPGSQKGKGAAIDLLDASAGTPVGSTDLAAFGSAAQYPAVAEGHVFVMVDFQLVALAPPA